MVSMTLVGEDPNKEYTFDEYIQKDDPCFGKHYSQTAPECALCTALVIHKGAMAPLSVLCRAAGKGKAQASNLNRLTSDDVLGHMQLGATIYDLFHLVLGDANPDELASKARALLQQRMMYLQGKGIPILEVPSTRELKRKL